jgi:hypothetical protein
MTCLICERNEIKVEHKELQCDQKLLFQYVSIFTTSGILNLAWSNLV